MTKIVRHFKRRVIDDAKLLRLWSSRMTEEVIAKEMGHHPRALRRRAVKLGMPSSRRLLWEAQT